MEQVKTKKQPNERTDELKTNKVGCKALGLKPRQHGKYIVLDTTSLKFSWNARGVQWMYSGYNPMTIVNRATLLVNAHIVMQT